MIKRLVAGMWLLTAVAGIRAGATPPKLIVAIIVDQMRYDYLERFHDQFERGGFRLLTDHGAYLASAYYNYCPTVTAPGHSSYLSGSTPSSHGVIGNEWYDRKLRKAISSVYDPAYIGVGTTSTNIHVSPHNFIGSNFADQLRLQFGSKVVSVSMKDRAAVLPAGKKPDGAYWFDTKTGHFITSTYYRPELPEWLKKFNAREPAERYRETNWTRLLPPDEYRMIDNRAGEGRLNGEKTNTFPHVVHYTRHDLFEGLLPTPYGNDLLADLARAAIEGEHLGEGSVPDLLCVSFSALDLGGHEFGPYSQEMQDLVLRLDRTLEGFFTYLDHRIGLRNVQIVLTADHGVAPLPEFAKAQGLDAGRVNESHMMTSLSNHLAACYGTGDLFLSQKMYYGNLYYDSSKLKEHRISADDLSSTIAEWAYASGTYEAVFTRAQLLRHEVQGELGRIVLNGYNAERSGDLVLVLKPYLIPSSGTTGTTHGSPYAYDRHVPMLFFGGAFKPGRYTRNFEITDIVPTLCAELHMDVPPMCFGHPYDEMLSGR